MLYLSFLLIESKDVSEKTQTHNCRTGPAWLSPTLVDGLDTVGISRLILKKTRTECESRLGNPRHLCLFLQSEPEPGARYAVDSLPLNWVHCGQESNEKL